MPTFFNPCFNLALSSRQEGWTRFHGHVRVLRGEPKLLVVEAPGPECGRGLRNAAAASSKQGDSTRYLFLCLDLVPAKALDFRFQRGDAQNQNVLKFLVASSKLEDLTRYLFPCPRQLAAAVDNLQSSRGRALMGCLG